MGGREAAFHVGTTLGTSVDDTDRQRDRGADQQAAVGDAGRYDAGDAEPHAGQHSEDRAGEGADSGGDHRFDEQCSDHRCARYAVGSKDAEFPGPVGDRPGGRDGHFGDTDEQNGHRDQHHGTPDLVGMPQSR